ncbi:energy-coupling factor ABC transporter ATP-binding protein [Scopulibacillus cellulosilyticus]|uniref:Energy-coupling factor ABC transporter ATP-binding protein n=1 Tax=Scopulibacillus cellulosilyticus TaxID=2665665 RepID=A0ABW2Q4I4_9BACL
MAYISLKNVSYTYPTSEEPTIKNLSVELEKGKFYAVAGANSSGKTTLCNIIRGFIPHFYKGDLNGEVWIDGKNISEQEFGDLAIKIGYIFQNPFNQISGIKETVFEELSYGLENFGVPRDEIFQRVGKIIELAHLKSLVNKNPIEMSGGQQQLVALASILVMEPDIFVIDEPTSQLDPQGTEEVFKLIKLMKEKGKTIILVEHKIDLIAEYADEVIVIKDGELMLQGETKAVLTDERLPEWGVPYTEYTKLGMSLKNKGFPLKEIPITLNQAVSFIEKRRTNHAIS